MHKACLLKWTPFICLALLACNPHPAPQEPQRRPAPLLVVTDLCPEIRVDSALYHEGWHDLPQTRFWARIMRLSPDTVLVNIGKTREVTGAIPADWWATRTSRQKETFSDSVRRRFNLPRDEEIFFTAGKNHFYRFDLVAPDLAYAAQIFQSLGVDPWYAQAIMLIESPAGLQVSTAGAYGPFQLMEGVARQFGLVVNDSTDEREVFECSAEGAARLIQTVCVPKARAMAEFYHLPYQETDIWFRLLTLHVYHAGAGNVRGVMGLIQPREGGQKLIQQIWQTKYRNFGNSSQNYSQLVLAALAEGEKVVRALRDSCLAASGAANLPPEAKDTVH